MATITTTATLCFHSQNPVKTLRPFSLSNLPFSVSKPNFCPSFPASKSDNANAPFNRHSRFSCNCISTATPNTNYQFSDGSSEVELRLSLGGLDVQSSRDIFVDADGSSLIVRVKHSGSLVTLIETNQMFEKIKPAETIWFVMLNIHGFD
ncbi:unnamed protein product [Dovyalis caffra]|uniref:Uncharacterized protein n=1 Tax=Dovyalis caffra TaxID=77055 RepID=A0AAV1SU45_9ROSI|nr:unnamed protein product [Dovyalis caffra]